MKNIFVDKKFIINSNGEKVGVLLNMDTYRKMELFYEDFILGKKMAKAKKSKSYSLKEAAKKLKYEL